MRNDELPVILCTCKIWFVILKEEHRVRGYERRMPKGIFESKREQ
jgi:hypothetical protein